MNSSTYKVTPHFLKYCRLESMKISKNSDSKYMYIAKAIMTWHRAKPVGRA